MSNLNIICNITFYFFFKDHDECASGNYICPDDEGFKCENLFGSYHCVCKPGYSTIQDSISKDIFYCSGTMIHT